VETFTLNTGLLLYTHDREHCYGPPCVVHSPSDHHMRDWRQHWRDDRGIMERLCVHGVGHPDPDDLKVRIGSWAEGVHGCDGCCFKPDHVA